MHAVTTTYKDKLLVSRSSSPSPRRTYLWTRRRRGLLSWTAACLAFVLAFILLFTTSFGVIRGLSNVRDQRLKRQPTIFNLSLPIFNASNLLPPQHPIRYFNGTHIDTRYTFQKFLAKGYEGSASIYLDLQTTTLVVIKSMTSPAWNPLPNEGNIRPIFEEHTTTWPTELHTSLLLNHVPSPLDYFLLYRTPPPPRKAPPTWSIVSPFHPHGTLETLNLTQSLPTPSSPPPTTTKPPSPSSLDTLLRPPFLSLLKHTLLPIHHAGYCHNDIKPDNIFLLSNSSATSPEREQGEGDKWLLSDWSNFKPSSHAWLLTSSWKRQNQWGDCVLNDLRRAVKSYVWGLRCGFVEGEEGEMRERRRKRFDWEFYVERKKAWARVYWEFMDRPVGTEGLVGMLERGEEYRPGEEADGNEELGNEEEEGGIDGWDEVLLHRAVERELRCIFIPWPLEPWWPFAS